MREEDIRPAQLQEELKALLTRDRERWLQDRDDFVRVECPACGHRETINPIDVRSYTFETCADCETVFYNPRPTMEHMHRYYAEAQSYTFWANRIFPETEDARRRNIFQPMADRVASYARKLGVAGGTMVEVGAGFGIFAQEIRQRGIFDRVIAVEPTPDLARKCRDKDLETLELPYEQLDLPAGSVNCVASFEVIEHLFAPKTFLATCHRLLRPSGLLILTCPNVKGFDFTVLGVENAPNFGLEHINMFHPRSLRRLVEAHGFKVEDLCTPGQLDADIVRNQALQGKFDLSGHPFLKRVLMDEWENLGPGFQKFLSDHQLSSSMMVVARKIGTPGDHA
jgi:2-polyprenyl-3-methyl-5-hydroxy-6-metoxy-1,4-benzoquinol methylase|nr:class I SAM-dependent methyltransferase [Candidatus Krumholzibacteria bacterium]